MVTGDIKSSARDIGFKFILFPCGFWKEFAALLRLAWPLSLSMMFQYILQPIGTAFYGQLGKTELAASSLAMTVIYLCTISTGRGLAFGGDTFFAQTYGSENKKNVGVYLQKGIIFCFLWSMPMIGILINADAFLLLLGQDPVICRLAQKYITVFCPGTIAYFCFYMIMRYLLCQNKIIAVLVICIISSVCNVVMNYLFIYVAELGIIGPAVALCLTYYLILVLLLLYIKLSGLYLHTWDGWSFHCLEDWDQFSYITSYSLFMNTLNWFVFLVGTFISGFLSASDLSSYYITFELVTLTAMVIQGIAGACTSRFGQYLGANRPKEAVNTARVALVTVILTSATLVAICFGMRFYIPYIFTSNEEVQNKTSSLVPVTCVYILLEGFTWVILGIIRGTGRTVIGVIIILVSYYAIALPVGIPLTLVTNMGAYGLWIGFGIGIIVQCFLSIIFFWKCDFKKEAQIAVKRSQFGKKTTGKSTTNFNSDERAYLLKDASCDNTDTDSKTISYKKTNSPFYRRNLIMKRLLTTLIFATPLIISVFTRMYLETNTNFHNNGTYFQNITILYNSTDSV